MLKSPHSTEQLSSTCSAENGVCNASVSRLPGNPSARNVFTSRHDTAKHEYPGGQQKPWANGIPRHGKLSAAASSCLWKEKLGCFPILTKEQTVHSTQGKKKNDRTSSIFSNAATKWKRNTTAYAYISGYENCNFHIRLYKVIQMKKVKKGTSKSLCTERISYTELSVNTDSKIQMVENEKHVAISTAWRIRMQQANHK